MTETEAIIKTRERRKVRYKTEVVGIRLNKIERRMLEEQAERHEMSISEYVRLLLYKHQRGR